MDPKSRIPIQRTWLGVLCCVSALVPVVGVALNWLVLKTSEKDTNANTCAMIGIVLAWIVTIIGMAALGLYLFVLWAFNGRHH